MVAGHFETLNSIVDKDAPATPINQPRRKWYSGTARGTSWNLFFGTMAGAAIGVLHLTALANGWKFVDGFELLELPVTSLRDAAWHSDSAAHWLASIADLAIIVYWPLIGLFVASLICCARDRTGRRALLFGASQGVFVGFLNVLAIGHRWFGMLHWFDILDQPARPLEEAVRFRIEDVRMAESLRLYRTFSRTGVPFWRLTYVVYWFAIGLLLASLFCVVRILIKRRTTKKIQATDTL